MISAIFVTLLLFSFGHGEFTCPDPASSSQLFLDIEQLNFFFANFGGFIRTPMKCSVEDYNNSKNGPFECADQTCCGNDIGCCFKDASSGKGRCGCKIDEDSECGPAPLAFISNSVCEAHKKAEVSMCFRKKNDAIMTTHVAKNPFKVNADVEESGCSGDSTAPVDKTNTETMAVFSQAVNDESASLVLAQFTAKQLEEKLQANVLAELMDRVQEKRSQGLSFGLKE